MQVYDEDENEILSRESTLQDKGIQTESIRSLPCGICIENDVSVHPAVSAGVVGLDVASVFIQDTSCMTKPSVIRRKRQTPIGQCLTAASEIERREREKKEHEEKTAEKQKIHDEKKAKREARMMAEAEKKASRAAAKRARENPSDIDHPTGLVYKGLCVSCKEKVVKREKVPCVICNGIYHAKCVGAEGSFVSVCTLCSAK